MERKEENDEFISYISGGKLITAEEYYEGLKRNARNKEIKEIEIKLKKDREYIEKMLQGVEKNDQIYEQKKQYDKVEDNSYSKVSIKRTPSKKQSISKAAAKKKRKMAGTIVLAAIASFMMFKTVNAINYAGQNSALYNEGKEILLTVAAESLDKVGITSTDENGVKTIIVDDYSDKIEIDEPTPAVVYAYLAAINEANPDSYDVSDKMIQTMYGHKTDKSGRDILTPYSSLEDYRARENLLENNAFNDAVYNEIIEAQKNGTLDDIVSGISQNTKGVTK